MEQIPIKFQIKENNENYIPLNIIVKEINDKKTLENIWLKISKMKNKFGKNIDIRNFILFVRKYSIINFNIVEEFFEEIIKGKESLPSPEKFNQIIENELEEEKKYNEKYEKFIKFISKTDNSIEVYDNIIKNKTIKLKFKNEYKPIVIFNKLKIDENLLYSCYNGETEFDKFFKMYYDEENNITKGIIDDKLIYDSLNNKNIFILYYPEKIKTKYINNRFVKLIYDFNDKILYLYIDYFKDINHKNIINSIKEKFNNMDLPLNDIEDVLDTKIEFNILGENIINDFYMTMIFNKFPEFVYIEERNESFGMKKLLKFFLVLYDNRISISIYYYDIKKSESFIQNNRIISLIGGEYLQITLSGIKNESNIDITKKFIIKSIQYYKKHFTKFNNSLPKYLQQEEPKPKDFKIKEGSTQLRSLLELREGKISRIAGKRERLYLDYIEEDEIEEYEGKVNSEGIPYQIMKFPPPNMKELFPEISESFYIISGRNINSNYPYIGLINSNNQLEPNIPYIPALFENQQIEIDKNFNVSFLKSMNTNYNRLLNPGKFLTEGRIGKLYKSFEIIIGKNYYVMGVPENNSFIHAILTSIGDKKYLESDSKNEYVSNLIKIIANEINFNICKQELYDYNLEEIKKKFLTETITYEKFYRIFQNYFKILIFVFRKKEDIELVFPRYKNFYIFNNEFFPENDNLILLYQDQWGNYNSIFEEKRENKKYIFGKNIGDKIFELRNKLNIVKQIRFKNSNFEIDNIKTIGFSNIYNFNIISQHINFNGKVDSINIEWENEKVTIFIPLSVPMNLNNSSKIYEISGELAIKILKITKKELKISIQDNYVIGFFSDDLFIKILKEDKKFYEDYNIIDLNPIRFKKQIKDENNIITGILLRIIIAAFLTSKTTIDNFINKYIIIKKEHKYYEQYSEKLITNISDILENNELDSYIKDYKIILTEKLKDKIIKILIYVEYQLKIKNIFFTGFPIYLDKKYINIDDFDKYSQKDKIFNSIYSIVKFIIETKNIITTIQTNIPIFNTKIFFKEKENNILINYNVPFEPFLYKSKNEKYYLIQFVQDDTNDQTNFDKIEELEELNHRRAINVSYYWNKKKINLGFYSYIDKNLDINNDIQLIRMENDRTLPDIEIASIFIYKTEKLITDKKTYKRNIYVSYLPL